jgi:hypothetical protein
MYPVSENSRFVNGREGGNLESTRSIFDGGVGRVPGRAVGP